MVLKYTQSLTSSMYMCVPPLYLTLTGEESYCPGAGKLSLDSLKADSLLVKDKNGA